MVRIHSESLNNVTMVIKNILKTLSDGELMAIVDQLANVDIDEQLVYKQLIAKGNLDETLDQMYHEMNSDELRGTLPRMVASELSTRYKKLIMRDMSRKGEGYGH
jgi:hypothetical protein